MKSTTKYSSKLSYLLRFKLEVLILQSIIDLLRCIFRPSGAALDSQWGEIASVALCRAIDEYRPRTQPVYPRPKFVKRSAV